MRVLWTPLRLLSPLAIVKAGPTPTDRPPASNNILDYVDSVASTNGSNGPCSWAITTDGSERYLAFPNARINHQTSGTIDCHTRLGLLASQTGYRFSVSWVSLSGYLKLEPGAYMERFNVSLGYVPGAGEVGNTLIPRFGKMADFGRWTLPVPRSCTGSTVPGMTGISTCLYRSRRVTAGECWGRLRVGPRQMIRAHG